MRRLTGALQLVPLARHSPFPELKAFVDLFKPQTIVPNTLDLKLENLDWQGIHSAFSSSLSGVAHLPSTQDSDYRVLHDLSNPEDALDVELKNLVGDHANAVAERWVDHRGKQRKLEVLRGWLGIPDGPPPQSRRIQPQEDSQSSDVDDDLRERGMHNILAPSMGYDLQDSQEADTSSVKMEPSSPVRMEMEELGRLPSPVSPVKRRAPFLPVPESPPAKKQRMMSPLPRSSPPSSAQSTPKRPREMSLEIPSPTPTRKAPVSRISRQAPRESTAKVLKASKQPPPVTPSPRKRRVPASPSPAPRNIPQRKPQAQARPSKPLSAQVQAKPPSRSSKPPSRQVPARSKTTPGMNKKPASLLRAANTAPALRKEKKNAKKRSLSPDSDLPDSDDKMADYLFGGYVPQPSSEADEDEDAEEEAGAVDEEGPEIIRVERVNPCRTPSPSKRVVNIREELGRQQKFNRLRHRTLESEQPHSPKLKVLERRVETYEYRIEHMDCKAKVEERQREEVREERERSGSKLDNERIRKMERDVERALAEGKRSAEVLPQLECTKDDD